MRFVIRAPQKAPQFYSHSCGYQPKLSTDYTCFLKPEPDKKANDGLTLHLKANTTLRELRSAMVPRIGISTSSKREVPGDASSTGTRNEIDEATDEVMHDYADMDEAGKRYSEETIDGIESSVSFLSSEGDGGKGTRWEERLKWWKVYALHFMFMWNSRTFEYVSVSDLQILWGLFILI